jgi:hypothetical protein
MNVVMSQIPSRATMLWAVLMFAAASPMFSQRKSPYQRLSTALGVAVSDTLSGQNLYVSPAGPLPAHGQLAVNTISPGNANTPHVYEVRYTPDAGFLGSDTFMVELNYNGTYPFLAYRGYQVVVRPSNLRAQNDFAATAVGHSVELNVLSNDFSSHPPLSLSTVLLSNNGTAHIGANNRLVFTPETGYLGVAQVQYLVCDAINTCQAATASIGVHGASIPDVDTLHISTTRDADAVASLLRSGYAMEVPPLHGEAYLIDSVAIVYQPNQNFVGVDQFLLRHSASNTSKIVAVEILGGPLPNVMALDDFARTQKGQPIALNVRSNDIGNLLVQNWVAPYDLPGTLSGALGDGTVLFTPAPDFAGIATFQYQIGNQTEPNIETATVQIAVDDMPPIDPYPYFTIPAGSPFVIEYKVPFEDFEFQTLENPAHGQIQFYAGNHVLNLNGQTVEGYNLLVYNPEPNFIGTDEVAFAYCVQPSGECYLVKAVFNLVESEVPACLQNCVWAGDADANGIVNHRDLFPLGEKMGLEGAARASMPAEEWFGQAVADWADIYSTQLPNAKHTDTDGNGLLAAADVLPIAQHHGRAHNLVPKTLAFGKALPIQMRLLTPEASIGDRVEVEVSFGSAAVPVKDLYAAAFEVALSQNLVVADFKMEYADDTWLNRDLPSLWLSQNSRPGRLETSFTHTDGRASHGYGPVGKMSFIIIDIVIAGDPGGGRPLFSLTLENPVFLGENGMISNENGLSLELPIALERAEKTKQASTSVADLLLYPSPTAGLLKVQLSAGTMESLSIFDWRGQAVFQAELAGNASAQVDLSRFPAGIYFALVQTQQGRLAKKFEVAR